MSNSPALRAAIAGADACIYSYGVIGAHTTGAGIARARKALAAHRATREFLQSQTGELVPAPSAFDLPMPVRDATTAAALAALVENRMTGVLADAAAALDDDARARTVSDAMACAARAVTWGGASMAFPHA